MSSVRPHFGRRAAWGALAMLGSVALLAGCAAGSAAGTGDAAGDTAVRTGASGSVSTISPAAGGVAGNTTVTITGKDLSAVKSVKFGAAAVPVEHKAAGKVVVTAPAAPAFKAASVDVTLLDKGGNPVAARDDAYSYTVQSGVDQQLAYALKYWKNYNTEEYGDLNPVGGDCANFVSQTLVARGWKMNDQWYNHGAAADWSPAWGYVPAMDNYFRANAEKLGLKELSFDQRDQVALGDVAIFDWNDNDSPDHVQVVDAIKKVNGKIEIKMASHNDNFDFRDLDETITVTHPGAVGHFWHLTK